jgi:hypothetical protein
MSTLKSIPESTVSTDRPTTMSSSYITEDNNIATTVLSPQPQIASTGSMINVTLSILCTVKPAHAVTSIKQSLVLKCHFFLVPS